MSVLHQLSRDLEHADQWHALSCALAVGDVILLLDAAVTSAVLARVDAWIQAGVRVVIPKLEVPTDLLLSAYVEQIDDLAWVSLVAMHDHRIEWM